MKNNILWPLLCGLTTTLRLAAAEALPLLEIWSGREQLLPFQARQSWALLADHGRELSGGQTAGKISITLPPLATGCTETAKLQIDDHDAARIRIWPPQILAGWEADFSTASSNVSSALRKNGLRVRSAPDHDRAISIVGSAEEADSVAGLSLFFAEKRDFPLLIAASWTDYHFCRTKKPGCLSVLYDENSEIIDCRGRLSHIILSQGMPDNHSRILRQLVVLTPDFDFSEIDNIILLNTIIKGYRP